MLRNTQYRPLWGALGALAVGFIFIVMVSVSNWKPAQAGQGDCTDQVATAMQSAIETLRKLGIGVNPSAISVWVNPDGSCGANLNNGAGGTIPVAATPAAQTTPAPQATPEVDLSTCTNVPDFSMFVGKPYDLIAKLDAQKGKVPQNKTNFTINAEQGCMLYWTGAYVSPMPNGLEPLFTDGKTGVYLVRQGMVTVNFVGAWMKLAEYDSTAQPLVDAGLPTSCMPTNLWIEAYQTYKDDTEAFVRWADAQTNVEGAPYLQSRIRPNPLGAAHYSGYKPVTLVFWTRTGAMAGTEGSDYVILSQGNGITIYLVATDKAELTWSHTGAQLCTDLNPTRDLGW